MKKVVSIVLISIIVTLSAFLLCACSNNTADNGEDLSYSKVVEKGVLVVGLDDSFPPMGYIDTDSGDLVGFDVDLAREAASRLGIDIKFQPINWQTKELDLSNGNIDCIWNGLSKTDELERALSLSKAYMQNRQCILVNYDSPYYDLQDLGAKVFCVQEQSSAEHALDKNLIFKTSLSDVITTDSYKSAIMELGNGTIDAIGIDEVVARFYMAKDPNAYRILKNESDMPLSLATEDYVIGFRNGDEELKIKIEEALKSMDEDGTLAKISEKWFKEDITSVKNW